jgi:hypothetical protein
VVVSANTAARTAEPILSFFDMRAMEPPAGTVTIAHRPRIRRPHASRAGSRRDRFRTV